MLGILPSQSKNFENLAAFVRASAYAPSVPSFARLNVPTAATKSYNATLRAPQSMLHPNSEPEHCTEVLSIITNDSSLAS